MLGFAFGGCAVGASVLWLKVGKWNTAGDYRGSVVDGDRHRALKSDKRLRCRSQASVGTGIDFAIDMNLAQRLQLPNI